MEPLSEGPNFELVKALFKKIKSDKDFQEEKSIVFRKGQTLNFPESSDKEIYFVKKGSVKVSSTDAGNGSKRILGVFNPGSMIGNFELKNLLIYGTATALMDCELLSISKEVLTEIMNSNLL